MSDEHAFPPPPPLLVRGARVLTMGSSPGPRRGHDLNTLGIIDPCDLLITDGIIERIGPDLDIEVDDEIGILDAGGSVVMPAFVDCHTHACWSGDRLNEWDQKRNGASYLELLEAGGGIMSTVRSVRNASDEQLERGIFARRAAMLEHGSCAIEVKSGYGLSTEHELRMLRAIIANADTPTQHITPTACIGHAIDGDADDFVRRTIEETLPAVHEEFPGISIDAYCEQGAWSLDQCLKLFDRSLELGHPLRVHADQFNDLGMIPEAVRRGFLSVDHLEASSPEHLTRLAESETFGVMLPCSGWHTDGRYADGRAFVDAGGAIAIATNYNPGSSPCGSMPAAIALAVRHLGLTPAEAIAASTINPAALLGISDTHGRIAEGMSANLILLRHSDERMLAYEFGMNPVMHVIASGYVLAEW